MFAAVEVCSESMPSEKHEDISEAVSHLLEECRMVLPGIQALFGFQLIAVFNQRFDQIPTFDQMLHLAATTLVAIAAALIMAPAAYHRMRHENAVSEHFVHVCTRFIIASMLLLACGIPADLFIIAAMILRVRMYAAVLAVVVFVTLVSLWFVFPCCKSK
jgi:Family of unknown function (DUF6328)